MNKSTFNMLTFDGGGLRGSLSIRLFDKIQKEYPNILKETNLLGGTSTGSLIALGLSYGLSCESIKKLYSLEYAKYIFKNPQQEIFRPKYNNDNLKKVLLSIFPEDLRLKDLKKLVVIPTFYIGDDNNSWRAIYYNNLPNSETENARVVDVAMSSCAALIFFPTYKNHIDGGIMANNPSLACLIYAMSKEIGKSINDIRILSKDTGYKFDKIIEDTSEWGALDWILSNEPDFPIISVVLESSLSTSNEFCKKLLEDNYFRVNPKTDIDIGMDNYNALDYLNKVSNDYDVKDIINWLNTKWK